MKLSFMKKLRYFQDLATSLRLGSVKADKRIQVKMPSLVVEELSQQFPNTERSHLLTQLAVDLIAQRMKFQDRTIIKNLQASEQTELNEMWKYLEKRDAE